jgi:mannosyltransferase
MFIVSFKIPMFLDRYLIFISPGFYLLIGVSFSYLLRSPKWYYIIGLGLVCMMFVTLTPNTDNKRRIREVVEKVKELKQDNATVFICPEWLDLGFTYYYNNNYFRQYKEYREKLRSENIYPINSVAQIDTNLIKSCNRVIYFEEWATLVDKDSLIYKKLSKKFPYHSSFKIYENFHVHEFNRSL